MLRSALSEVPASIKTASHALAYAKLRFFLCVVAIVLHLGFANECAAQSTTTALTVTSGGSAVTTVAAGAVVTLTATVKAGTTAVHPGQVHFCDATAAYCTGPHLLGIAQISDAGTAIYKFLPGLGAHSYRAVFLGTNSHAASASATTTLTVTGTIATTTTIAQSGAAGNYTLRGTVVGAPYPAQNATQSVTINLAQSAQNYVLTGTGPSTVNGSTYGNYYNTQGSCLTTGATTTCDLTGTFTSTTAGYAAGTYDFQTVFTGSIASSVTSQTQYPVGTDEPNDFQYSAFAPSTIMVLKLNVTGGGAYTIPLVENGNFDPNLDNIGFADTSPVCGGTSLGSDPCQQDYVGTVPGATYSSPVTGLVQFEMASPPTLVGPTGTISFLDTSNASAVVGTGALGAGTPGLSFASQSSTANVENPQTRSAVADFNGDGILDVATASTAPDPTQTIYANSVTISLGLGDGTFNTLQSRPATGNRPQSIVAGDFNGDGKADLAVTNISDGTVTVLLGNGDGTFTAAATAQASANAYGLVTGDFNGDGNLDLAVSTLNGIAMLLGNGDGTFVTSQITLPSASNEAYGPITTADFNGDGKADLIVEGYSPTGGLVVLLGNGDGSFATGTPISLPGQGSNLNALVAGDFNGDGKPDFAATNSSQNTVLIMLGNGDGTFTTTAAAAATFYDPEDLQTGDFDGDGKLDLVVMHLGGSHEDVLLGNGDGTFTTAGIPTGVYAYNAITVGDFNGDGVLDVAATDGSTNLEIALTQRTQTAVATATGIAPVVGTHEVVASYPGDANFVKSVSQPTAIVVGGGTATSVITWVPTVATIPYGTALGAAQLDATAATAGGVAIPGTFAYTPAAGAVLPVGTQTLSVTFTPTSTSYSAATKTVQLVVTKFTPVLTWANPAAITITTPLSATQLDAAATDLNGVTVAGTYAYTPAAGTTLSAGTQTLHVTFTPSDAVDYTTATDSTTIVVTNAAPSFVSNVGTALAAKAVGISVANAGTLNSIQVLTQGVTGLDFTAATGGSCTTGSAYTVGQSCTVNVIFDPQHAGNRPGAVLLLDGNKNTLGIAYLQGSGVGPQIIFGAGSQSVLGGGFNSPQGLGLDGSGNVYVADQANGAVKEIPAGCTAANCVTTLASGFMYPNGLSVDGAGNLFFDDFTNSNNSGSSSSDNLAEEIPFGCASASCFRSLGSGFDRPAGIAVDVNGNVFVSDWGNNAVKELLAVNGVIPQTPTINVLAGGFTGQTGPDGLTLDASGNVFVADHDDGHALYEIPIAGGYSTLNTISNSFTAPEDVAFDGTGNAYVVDEDTNAIYKLPAVGGSLPATPSINTLANNFNSPEAVVVDALGNVYVSDYGNQRVVKIDYSDAPSLSFATATAVGSTDTTDGPQQFTIQNNGNAALTFTGIAASTNFKIDSTKTTCSTSTALAAGASCVVGVDLVPTAAGSLSGTLTVTDNALNAAGTTQSIPLSGTGVAGTSSPVTPVITWVPTVTTIPYGTALGAAQLDATAATAAGVTIPGTFVYTPAAGAVLKAGTQTLSVAFTPTSATYSAVTATATITVTAATPVITWAAPAEIAYGTPLSAAQLDATVAGAGTGMGQLPGTLVYTPAAGTVLTPGTQTLNVAFTPTDAVDYTTAAANVKIVVGGVGLSGIAPLGALLGSGNTTITLTGTGFVPTSVALAGTNRLATTYVNPTTLTAVVPATLLGATGALAIAVNDPSIGSVSAAQTFTVLAAETSATLTGPATTAPGTQPTVGLTITNPYPLALTAQFTLAFAGAAIPPVDDPSIQFSTGGRTYSYTVAANSTSVPPVQLQAGTDAGTITIAATLMADGVDVTPAGLPPLVIVVPPVAPVISGTTISASGSTLTVVIHGFSNTREVSQAVFDFTAATGDTLATPTLTIPATTIFSTWYGDATSDAYGSTFTYTQTFDTSNAASTVGKVKVTLTNSIGTSAASTSP